MAISTAKPVLVTLNDLISRLVVSALGTDQRADFVHWLSQRVYLRTTLDNALQKGQVLTVYVSTNPRTGQIGYGLRSQSRLLPTSDQVDLAPRSRPIDV